jgi:hypothetical protein
MVATIRNGNRYVGIESDKRAVINSAIREKFGSQKGMCDTVDYSWRLFKTNWIIRHRIDTLLFYIIFGAKAKESKPGFVLPPRSAPE